MVLIPGGLLRETVAVLLNTPVSNGAGGWTDAWAEVASCRGQLVAGIQGGNRETIISGQPRAAELVTIWLNTSTLTISGKHRLRVDGADYEILILKRQGKLLAAESRRV